VGTVTSLDPTQDLQTFLEFIYGNETGYAYSPTKNPETDEFKQYFFLWPTGKEELIEHIRTKTATHEVYYGPALYSTAKDAEKENFKGTNVVWVEFDGNSPAAVSDVPEPNIKIRSSTSQHEHWYWKLENFVKDIEIIENITARLAYHLNADLGCWNANRVLRPPSTTHHESGLTVTTFRWEPEPTSIHLFNGLPPVPVKILQEQDINYIPPVLDTIAKYAWGPDEFKFFAEPKIERGHRSSALAKLGHICIELGMSNAETLSILLNADSRWGKFSKRKDQKNRLLGIINYCRSRHPPVGQNEDGSAPPSENTEQPRLRVFTFKEFIETEINLEWVIEGLLHKKGLAMLSGPPDVGKSQLSIRFAEKLARGQDFLKWKVPKPMKTLLVSMEMPHEELHYLMDNMQMETEENSDLLNENLLVLPLGYSVRLGNKAAQSELAVVIDNFRPDGIIFDSFGVGVSDDLNSEKVILDALDYVHKTLRTGFGCFVWFIHHNRKAQIGNKKPTELDDLFGSRYIGAALTTAVNLWPVQSMIEVSNMKLRMAKKFDKFLIKRMTNLDFEIYTDPKTSNGKISIPSGVPDLDNRFKL